MIGKINMLISCANQCLLPQFKKKCKTSVTMAPAGTELLANRKATCRLFIPGTFV